MKTLKEIFEEIGNLTTEDRGCNDKGGAIHTYLETYDKLFERFRHGCTIMEIGLAMGDSIKLWDRYFENSVIIGVDISLVFEPIEYKNDVVLIECDATKPEFADKIIKDELFDIVIDDGSHVTSDQISVFNSLKHKMKKRSLYIVEDLLALDVEREKYLALHEDVEIIDMRHINGRFDNVLLIFRF